MFKVNEANGAAVDAAYKVLDQYGRGDVVPHSELSAAVGHVWPSPEYFRLVRAARDRYRDTAGVWSREVPGLGFRLLTVEESLTTEQSHRARRAKRQVKIASKVADSIPEREMSFHQRKLREAVLESTRQAARKIAEEQRHMAWLARPTPSKPRMTPIGK